MKTIDKKLIIKSQLCTMLLLALVKLSPGSSFRIPENYEPPSIYPGGDPDMAYYEDGDFDPPPPGKVMMAHWRDLKGIYQDLVEYITQINSQSNLSSDPLFQRILQFKTKFEHYLQTNTLDDLLALLPDMLFLWNAHYDDNYGDDSVNSYRGVIASMTFYVLKAAVQKITEQNGQLDRDTLLNLVEIMCDERNLMMDPWPEDDQGAAFTSAVPMIVDPQVVVDYLKQQPWQKAKNFLIGCNTPEIMFDWYEEITEGFEVSEVLMAKYKSNKELIDSKFYELKEWVEQQQALEPPPSEESFEEVEAEH